MSDHHPPSSKPGQTSAGYNNIYIATGTSAHAKVFGSLSSLGKINFVVRVVFVQTGRYIHIQSLSVHYETKKVLGTAEQRAATKRDGRRA